jgi:hypothetical protein
MKAKTRLKLRKIKAALKIILGGLLLAGAIYLLTYTLGFILVSLIDQASQHDTSITP